MSRHTEPADPELQGEASHALHACHECDLLQQMPELHGSCKVCCGRCGAVMRRFRENTVDNTLALALSGLLLFVLANFFPFMTFEIAGDSQENNLITGVLELYKNDRLFLAALVLGTTIVFPLAVLIALSYVLLPLKMGRIVPGFARVTRAIESFQPWGMMEVYMLAVLVSIVKLKQMAEIGMEVGFIAFSCLIFVSTWALSALDAEVLWDFFEKKA
jgi:paraquat-inducible protein A